MRSEKIFGHKILVKKNLDKFICQTYFLVKEFLLKKVFGSFESKNIVFKKNQEELTPGTGYMPPPPKKTVGLKLCWVIVSFAR